MVVRLSKKPEIRVQFRKFPEQPYVLSWLSVNVPAKKRHFLQKGNFQLAVEEGGVWNEPTVRRLEELSVRHGRLEEALQESVRSQPTVPSIGELKVLRARELHGLLFKRTAPYLEWAEQFRTARANLDGATDELASLEAEMAQHNIVPAMLNRVILLKSGTPDERAYALYRSAVWCSDRDLTSEQWRVLIDRFSEREEAEFAAVLSPPVLGGSESPRERIPPEVRRAVWIRDQGRCARCGGREKLEYDHIVPVSRGGSNTERNIELLCERPQSGEVQHNFLKGYDASLPPRVNN